MNLLERLGIPGEFFPIFLLVLIWLIQVPKDVLKTKKISWKNVEFTFVFLIALILWIMVIKGRS
jgi:hypothetical protein